MNENLYFVLKMAAMAGELFFSAFLFTRSLPFRKKAWIFDVGIAALLALLCYAAYAWAKKVPSFNKETIRALFGFAMGTIVVFGIVFQKNERVAPTFFFINLGFAAAYFSDRIGALLETTLLATGAFAAYSPWFLLFYLLPTVLFFFGVFFLFRNNFSPIRADIYTAPFFIYLPFFTLLVSMVLFYLGGMIQNVHQIFDLILITSEALYGLIDLLLLYALMRQRQNDFSLYILKQLWEKDRKNYELQKETVAMINVKCHDMRHQIRALEAKNGTLDPKMIESVTKSINVYESVVKTGNEVLDVILSDYSLRCQKNQVQLTYMVDGALLNSLQEMDIYSLFGNLLENALEYEQKVSPSENRFVFLSVKLDQGTVLIHEENYFQGEVHLKDGIVETSKPDKTLHGYGMLSMRQLAEKYGGSMRVYGDCDMFQVDIRLPQQKEEAK
jgi:hypothetical protein